MGTGRAVLPSVMVRRADGLQLLQRLGEASPLPITVRLTPQAFASNAERLASFSSRGPLPGVALKPEILAVGVGVLTAAQTNTPSGAVYSASGYRTIQGTSFSAPVVAGILAVLKSERPGLTTAAYRSLLVQSASPIEGVPLAQQGAGLARLEGALTNLLTLSNSTISFRENTEALEIRNLSGELQSVALSVESRRGVAPGLAESTVEIGANGSARLQLALDRAAVPAGTHEGFVVLRAAAGPAAGTVARVPYWFGKTSGTATAIQLLDATNVARAGVPQRDLLLFRVLDENGLALEEAPVVRVAAGTAQVREVQRRDGEVAGAWGLELTLGAGVNRLEIQAAGGLTRTITITGI
jgi:minor extracellular serine protease Vpr